MKGKLPLFPTVLLAALLCASLAMAQPPTGHRIYYSGMCAYEPITQTVTVDTVFVLSNPNKVQVNNVNIYIYDKDGNIVDKGPMLDGGTPRLFVPPNGWNYHTIGKLFKSHEVEPTEPGMYKYNVLITWDKPSLTPEQKPYRFMMCEVKQIVYETPQDPDAIWSNFSNIKDWSETALGGKVTTGTYKK